MIVKCLVCGWRTTDPDAIIGHLQEHNTGYFDLEDCFEAIISVGGEE